MSKKYKNIQWVIQKNLTNTNDLDALINSCKKIGVECIEINIVPFTSELPYFNKSAKSIFYGSTTFSGLVEANDEINQGLFFNAKTFSIENYFDKWGKHMLNHGAMVTTFNELILEAIDAEKQLFVRPDDDGKSFSGEVKKFKEIKEWYHQLKFVENTNLSLQSKIIVSEPYNIEYEWRLWIVNKKVVAASKYRDYFKLKKERGCPEEVISFAEERCVEYVPHDVFVMDICLCGDSFYIVECGCMNSAGFYAADIEAIVLSVSGYFENEVSG